MSLILTGFIEVLQWAQLQCMDALHRHSLPVNALAQADVDWKRSGECMVKLKRILHTSPKYDRLQLNQPAPN